MTHQCSETGWEWLGATPGMVHLESQLGIFKVIIEVSRRRGVKSTRDVDRIIETGEKK